MGIKGIEHRKCNVCELRAQAKCPVAKSCFQDVIRLDAKNRPYFAYPKDCSGCFGYYFACQDDCPYNAVKVTADFPLARIVA